MIRATRNAARRYVLEGMGDPAIAAADIERPRGPRIAVWRSKPWLDLLLGLGAPAIARLFGLGGGNWRATLEALRGFVAVNELAAARVARSFPPCLVDDLLSALAPIADVRIVELAPREAARLRDVDELAQDRARRRVRERPCSPSPRESFARPRTTTWVARRAARRSRRARHVRSRG